MYKILPFLFLLLFTFSCNKDREMPEVHEEYLIFGHYYGYCGGAGCIEIFKIRDGELYEDIEDNYPNHTNSYEGTFEKLSNEKYQLVADLPEFFPQQLVERTDTIYGIPDAYDQGGLYIEWKTENILRFWLIDQNTSNIPAFLHEFHEEVNEAIGRITE